VRVKFWGVRGSIPTPLSTEQLQEKLFQALTGAAGVNLSDAAEVQAYIARLAPGVRAVVGGNTTCVEVDTGDELIIIDAGSGMRPLGISLMAREFGRGQGVAHIFLTHAHWDHLQGYPFFLPAYVPGNKLYFYAINNSPQKYLEHQQVAPIYFPIPPNAMPADTEFVQLREGEAVRVGRTTVTSISLYHPGTAYAYRFDDSESVFVFASDGEYKSLTDHALRHYIDFFSNADALVFDSQYSLRDVFLSKADWGHSSAIIGVDIAERAKVKKLITFHHDPTHSDEQIYAIANSAKEYAVMNEIHHNTEVIVGTEGLELFLGQKLGLETVEQRADSTWTLALAGHLNAATAGEARARLRALLAEAPAQHNLLLDLTLLAAADAIGVKGLIDATRDFSDKHLAVLAPAAHIRRVLDQSGAGEVLKIFRNRQQALTALSGPVHLRLATETIGEKFRVDEMLFADDVGVVYAGDDRTAQLPVLVWVVGGKADDPIRAKCAAAVDPWQNLQHHNLLPVKAIISDEAWLAAVTPRPDGLALREWLDSHPAWPEVWHAVEQLCTALAALHQHGIVHGDLRPKNIVISGPHVQMGRTPLFAQATHISPEAYDSPERLRKEPVTMRTDVYSLGVILYELLLGAHPFAAESDELRLTLQLYSQPQSPRLRWPEIPEALERYLLKMLAHTPDERFATGSEVLAAFKELNVEHGPEG
jgi:phosphoribosyl 1,2-cyclic phosphodiesterase/anti-anti-sigma regulatory factor